MFKQFKSGFTVVELLVVIVVVGILVSITTVVYRGMQGDAHDTAVKSDLRQAYTVVVEDALKNRKFPTQSLQLDNKEINVSMDSYSKKFSYNFVYCPPFPYDTGTEIAFIGASKSGKIYSYDGNDAKQYTGSWTMNDYADICVDILDVNNEFDGDFNGPNIHVTCSGYDASLGGGGWRKWAGGTHTSVCW